MSGLQRGRGRHGDGHALPEPPDILPHTGQLRRHTETLATVRSGAALHFLIRQEVEIKQEVRHTEEETTIVLKFRQIFSNLNLNSSVSRSQTAEPGSSFSLFTVMLVIFHSSCKAVKFNDGVFPLNTSIEAAAGCSFNSPECFDC